MTSQPGPGPQPAPSANQPGPGPQPAPSANQPTMPLRELAALVLVGANALLLFVALIDLLIPPDNGPSFSSRAGSSFFDFAGITAIVLPLLAVLLATQFGPPVPRAKPITQAAVVEYAVSAFFGVVSFLGWLIGSLSHGAFRDVFTGFLTRIAFLAIFAVAAYAVYQVWRTHYYTPGPRREPGVYGRPQPAPDGYGQSASGQPQPGSPRPGYPAGQQSAGFGAPGGPVAPRPSAPGGYGAPAARPEGAPTSGAPSSGAPAAPAPASAAPARPAAAEPEPEADSPADRTQVISQPTEPESERTEVVRTPTESAPADASAGSDDEHTAVIPRPAGQQAVENDEATQMIIPSERGVQRPGGDASGTSEPR